MLTHVRLQRCKTWSLLLENLVTSLISFWQTLIRLVILYYCQRRRLNLNLFRFECRLCPVLLPLSFQFSLSLRRLTLSIEAWGVIRPQNVILHPPQLLLNPGRVFLVIGINKCLLSLVAQVILSTPFSEDVGCLVHIWWLITVLQVLLHFQPIISGLSLLKKVVFCLSLLLLQRKGHLSVWTLDLGRGLSVELMLPVF